MDNPSAQEGTIRSSDAVMESLGAEVVEVSFRDAHGGYLHTRVGSIRRRLVYDSELIWLNQYANPDNTRVHRDRTARAVHKGLGTVDARFVGAGINGTLMGCVEYFARHSPSTKVIGVDSVGSVTSGGPAAPRFIPDLGTSRRPDIYVDEGGFEKVLVREADTVAMCRKVAAKDGLLAGSSTGAVLAPVQRFAPTLPAGPRIAAIAPDAGDKYIDTVYSDAWVAERYTDVSGLADVDQITAS